MSDVENSLYDRITGALVWMAAFCLATGVFLSITLLFNALPPTAPVAIGAVTIERYSKLRDYLGAALFFLLVPPLTVWLEHVLGRAARRLRTMGKRVLFTVPYLLSPLFYLTTGKVGWILLLPVAFSLTGPRVLAFVRSRRWIRELFRPELRPYHALLFCEALSWLFYRYLATGRRLAHIPTLFLEVVFVALFLAIFWAAAILIARTCELQFGASAEEIFRRITVAALPLVVLPFLPAIWVPLPHPRLINLVALLLIALVALRLRRPMSPAAAWKLATYLIFPALIYLFSYASTAQLSQWIDLFHRGESIGPASDYLRGKVPFRDVFALHGMLEDGLLDSWLMELFGRSLDVAVMRSVILGSFLGVAIWFLGIAVFRSIPLALLCVAMGSWTTAENNRTLFQVAAVALFWHALRGGKTVGGRQSAVGSGTETTDAAAGFDSSTADRRPPTADSSRGSRTAAVLSGVFAGIALFFSYEIALYTIAGAFAASLLLWIASRRVPWDGLPPARAAAFFALGTALGAAPFVVYLAMHGAFDDFLVTSFVVIPNIIDAVWSLPFPDLVSTFRRDLNIHTLADFVVWEKFHLVLSPLTIVMAAIYSMARWLRRRTDSLDFALIVLTVFAIVAQRTAFGRASFQHQYFSAFLIGPLLVLLAVAAVRMLRDVWHGGGEGTRAFVAALAVAAVPVIAVLFWIPDLVNGRLHEFIRYSGRVLHVDREPQAEEVRWRIDDVSSGIRALTRRGEPIFDFSNQPAFYFFADRPNPTRFYQVPILSPRGFQAETIGALEKARPKVVIRRSPELFDQFDGVTNDLRAQAVSAYLDDTYRFFRSVRGVELWTRRPDARARKLSDYLALIRLPDEQELVNSRLERMVFPAVGSVPGVNGAFWQSDLTMHNPYREPLRLTLRYVTGERGTDRRLTLAPRQTLRWENVVRTLFQNDNSLGTLWVEHREGLAPVAVVKTSDVAHQASASVEQPLSRRDAATASTEHAELAIIGIPPAKGLPRRVNVGVVNLGTIPATFRVSARTRSGATAGGSVESGVPEDQVWLVNDIENELGMKLDETMTVRVTVIAGTGVAFATVVEYGGDSEFIAAIPAQQQ